MQVIFIKPSCQMWLEIIKNNDQFQKWFYEHDVSECLVPTIYAVK